MTVSENSRVLIHRNPQFARCPQCKSVGTLHRSRSRNMYEQIVRRITFFKTYRCKECGWRGFRSTLIFTKKSVRNIILYATIIILTAFVARYFIFNFALK